MPVEHRAEEYAAAKAARRACVDAVVNSPARKKLVAAGPGTGKTFLFQDILKGKNGALTLTFVNALVDDLSLKLYGLSEVMTLHGYALHLLKNTFKGVPCRIHPLVRKVIEQDAVVLLGDSVDFEALINTRADNDARLAFYAGRRQYYGYFHYTDAIYAAVLHLERQGVRIPEYPLVVVDEFQDFTDLEVSLLELLARKSPVLFAGDDDQALYAFRKASPKHIRDRRCGKVTVSCRTWPTSWSTGCARSARPLATETDYAFPIH